MKQERISIDPKIMGGKPCIAGTRLTVELILEKLAAGMSYDDLLEDHPRLQHDDILAALHFAHDYLAHHDIIPSRVENLEILLLAACEPPLRESRLTRSGASSQRDTLAV